MAELDEFLSQDNGEEDQWDSDNESVPQDKFNKVNLNAASPMQDHEIPVPVKSSTKAEEMEDEYLNEQLELNQAREIKKQASPKASVPAPKFESTGVPPVNVQRAPSQPKFESTGGFQDPAFAGRYPEEVVEFFSEMNKLSITQQAVEYLNAYWDEVGDQAEFIFSVAIKQFRAADMHRQGITLQYKYDEGSDVDYPTYLYFYEKLVQFVGKNPQWRTGIFEKSAVYEVKTAIKHKNDLKEKVDVNFDGRISFLEFLLYQYNAVSNPLNFMERSKVQAEEHPAITAARLALDQVNKRIREYEEERARLQEGAAQAGVKGLTFKHQLTMLDSGPLSEHLNQALITAEAAVRMAVKKFNGQISGPSGTANATPQGALWWMQRDLEEKKKVVIPATLRRIKKNK